MPEWLVERAQRLLGWLCTVPFLPKCLRDLIQQALSSLLHLAAVSFGVTFCHLAYIDVAVNKQAFQYVGFATGAGIIIGAWGTLWLTLRHMKQAGKIESSPTPGA